MYLHENKENFRDVLENVAKQMGQLPSIIEKDYYVTLILKLLSEQLPNCVFKGGTSLSKGFHIIDRFSEDIDITFNEHIGEARRKKLKNITLKGISEELGLPITNWEKTQSDRDYNAYHFAYDSVFELQNDSLLRYIKLETALGSYSFPTETIEIKNYIGDYLISKNREDIAAEYKLNTFSMQLQSVERTFIDKIFALCDYYLQGKVKRYSRHLYDIYKLTPFITFDNNFMDLVEEVRMHRAKMPICPSAQEHVDIVTLVNEFCDNDFYKDDYETITIYLISDNIPYTDVVKNIKYIVEKCIN